MAFAGGIFGASAGDYNGIANSIKDPNAANYTNSDTGNAVQTATNIGGGYQALQGAYGALGAQGYGNSGLAAQQQGLNAITNMAQGKGPSLAAANMQAGLNSTFQNLSNQAMSNQGNVGAGNSQRNLLNAQANAANNVSQQAGQASVAEQMGALQQQNQAAQALTSAQLAQQAGQQANLAGQGSALQGNLGATQAAFGDQQTQTQDNMQMSADQMAQQNARAGYKAQAANANSAIFKNVLGAAGQVASIAGGIMTGGASTAAQGLASAAGNAMGGGGGNAGALAPPGQDYVSQRLGQQATNSFNNLYGR